MPFSLHLRSHWTSMIKRKCIFFIFRMSRNLIERAGRLSFICRIWASVPVSQDGWARGKLISLRREHCMLLLFIIIITSPWRDVFHCQLQQAIWPPQCLCRWIIHCSYVHGRTTSIASQRRFSLMAASIAHVMWQQKKMFRGLISANFQFSV